MEDKEVDRLLREALETPYEAKGSLVYKARQRAQNKEKLQEILEQVLPLVYILLTNTILLVGISIGLWYRVGMRAVLLIGLPMVGTVVLVPCTFMISSFIVNKEKFNKQSGGGK